MLLDESVNSVIIVDDIKDELLPLRKMLEEKEIHVDSFVYPEEKIKTFHRNHQLIFLDWGLNGNPNQVSENISIFITILQKLCSETFGLYGLVVWTKHPEKVEELEKKIGIAAFSEAAREEVQELDDEKETTLIKIHPPLFILVLNKNKYIHEGNYLSLPQDIDEELKKKPAAYFYFKWSVSIQASKDKTIKSIYQLIHDYQKQDEYFLYILYRLALNYTGIPCYQRNDTVNLCVTDDDFFKDKNNNHSMDNTYITVDAYKAFDELFYSNLMTLQRKETIPSFMESMQNPFDNKANLKLSAMLNERICIDTTSISQNIIVPGNVYKVKDSKSPLRVKLSETPHKNFLQKICKTTIIPIAIELTPPCDFSNEKKKISRFVGGYIFDVPQTITKDPLGNNKSDRIYNLWPISINDEKICYIIFDFCYLYTPSESEICDLKKYEVWFRAKPKLFSDVLQKFSSHASRLGLSSINLMK